MIGIDEKSNHWDRARWIKASILVLLTFCVYLPAINSGFIWDDDRFLWQNPLIHASDGLFKFWFSTEAPDYFPLTSSTLWIEWRLFGKNASGYHLINVLLHIGSSLFLWRIFARLKVPTAWLAALVFALHPVNVESVAWITERKNTLSMFFFCASIWAWLRFDDARQRGCYAASLIAFLLALLSKTSVVMLPVVLLMLIWWRRERISRRDFSLCIPFFALSALLSLVTIWFQYQVNIQHEVVRDDSLIARTAGAAWAICFYAYKTILPINLSFVYPRWEIAPSSLLAWVPMLALAAIFALCYLKRNSWGKPILFGLGCFVITLFPVLGFLDIYFMRYSLVADHWQYVSLPALLALIVGGTAWLLHRNNISSTVIHFAAALLVLVLTGLTWHAQTPYENEETLWLETLKQNEEAFIALNNLGVIRERENQFAEAEEYYRRAISAYPEYREAHFNLGHVLAETGNIPEAIEHYRFAVKLDPKYVLAWNNLGNALNKSGRPNDALSAFERALEIEPGYPDALSNMGSSLASLGKLKEAAARYEEALAIEPNHPGANSNYGSLLAAAGNFSEAITHFRIAAESNPDNPAIWYNLASAEHLFGNPEAALLHYEKALELNPRLDMAALYAAEIHLGTGRPADAVKVLERLVETSPDSLPAVNMLSWVLATHHDDSIRDGVEALKWAERADKISGGNNPAVLDTLATAQAAAGDFDLAVKTAGEALRIAVQFGNEALQSQIRQRLEMFSNKKPFIER